MKKGLFALLLLFNFGVKGQQYFFNILTKYSHSYKSINSESVVYANANNPHYFMYIKRHDSVLNAKLYDTKTSKCHSFIVKESKNENNETEFQFAYDNSADFRNPKRSFFYKFEEISSDSLTRNMKLNFYKNDRKKKIDYSVNLKIKKRKDNLFPHFRASCLHPLEFSENLNFDNKGVVEYAAYDRNGDKYESKLEFLKEIGFSLKVNQKP